MTYVKEFSHASIGKHLDPALSEAILCYRDDQGDHPWQTYQTALEEELLNILDEKARLTNIATQWILDHQDNVITKQEFLVKVAEMVDESFAPLPKATAKPSYEGLVSKVAFFYQHDLLPKAAFHSKRLFLSLVTHLPEDLFPVKEDLDRARLLTSKDANHIDFLHPDDHTLWNVIHGLDITDEDLKKRVQVKENGVHEALNESNALLLILTRQLKDSRDTKKIEMLSGIVAKVKRAQGMLKERLDL